MKMKNAIFTKIPVYTVILLLFACAEEKIEGPYGQPGIKPDQVKNITVKNIPGGAEINYSLPKNDDLLYVKAVYYIRKGVRREAKASYHKNTLIVDGFPEVETYDVDLYTVGRSEIQSDPVTIQVHPETPPVIAAFQSMELKETFGGVAISFENYGQADLAITVITPDSVGKMAPAQTFYTKQERGILASRGFESEKRLFGVYLRDRWENYSDTLFAELTPLLEQELDKLKFQILPLATDDYVANPNTTTRPLNKLWDGVIAGGNNSYTGPFITLPTSFSIDLGAPATLSRLVYYPKAAGANYYVNSPKRFEIWGTNEPAPDGSWESWTKLMDCEWIKPSGLPGNQLTEEDREFSAAGIEFGFPDGGDPVRYIRFKTLELWQGQHLEIFELTFFGNSTN